MRLFLDTGLLVARISPRDEHHEAALAVLDRIEAGEFRSVHTSDYVVAETLNFVRAKIKRAEAGEAVLDAVFGTDDAPPVVASVLRVHSARFASALEQYRRRFRSGLSFTDWTSVVLMEEASIDAIATFDHGFRPFAKIVDG